MTWDQFGPAYDFPLFEASARTYLIASTPRSGSHYLGRLLFETGGLGAPLEYFHPNHMQTWRQKLGTKTSQELFRGLLARRTSPSGWFGVKAHWPQFEAIRRDREIFDLLAFSKYIRIARRDTLAQAISLVIARQSEAWISFHQARQVPAYDFATVRSAVAEIELQDLQWRTFFQSENLLPMEIFYEDIVQDELGVVQRICSDFGAPVRSGSRKSVPIPQRQSSEINEQWRRQFIRDCEGKEDLAS